MVTAALKRLLMTMVWKCVNFHHGQFQAPRLKNWLTKFLKVETVIKTLSEQVCCRRVSLLQSHRVRGAMALAVMLCFPRWVRELAVQFFKLC